MEQTFLRLVTPATVAKEAEVVTTSPTDPDNAMSPRTRLRQSQLWMLAAVSVFLGGVLVLVSLADYGL